MPPNRQLPPLLRTLSLGVFCLALLVILGGGSSCSWKTGSNHDDDSDDDDQLASSEDEQGGGRGSLLPSSDAIRRGLAKMVEGVRMDSRECSHDLILPELGSEELKLTDFSVDLESRSGRHPIARLREIRGLSITNFANLHRVSAEALRRFSTAVITLNPDLLGLPPAAGYLRGAGVHVVDQLIMVVHEQVHETALFPHQDIPAGGEMIFVFDLLGRLVQVENRTTLPPGVSVPVPEDLLPMQ